jgi:hypothetical protein
MKFIAYMFLLVACCFVLNGCTASSTANNTTANAANIAANTVNTAAKPAPPAPTAETLMALDKTATEAYWKGDAKAFETILSDKITFAGNPGGPDKAATLKQIASVKCDIKSSSFEDAKSLKINDDTYVVNYKGTVDGTCNDGPNGQTVKADSPFRGTTVWVRNGDKWQAAFHGENPIIDPNAPAKPAEKKPALSKTEAPAAAAAGAKSPNTDALAAAEKAGWIAWINRDAKVLESFVAKDVAIATPEGTWMNDSAAIVKYWLDAPCKDMKNVEIKNPVGVSLGADIEMLTFTSVVDGTCGGQKNTPQAAMSLYRKEGGAWKLVFGFSAPPEA